MIWLHPPRILLDRQHFSVQNNRQVFFYILQYVFTINSTNMKYTWKSKFRLNYAGIRFCPFTFRRTIRLVLSICSKSKKQKSIYRYLQNRFSFIDKSKTAIWGWSYGGYTTGMVLTKDINNVFKCGLSVAPVTDWIYYGT